MWLDCCVCASRIMTVVIISLSAIFAMNLSWHDNLRLFYSRCFPEPLLSGVARRCVCRGNRRQMHSECESINTTQNGPSRFAHCHQAALVKWRENDLIDEQSSSTHVINTLLMALNLSSKLWTQRKAEQRTVMGAPNWPPCNVRDCVSFARFCYLMACREAVGTM